LTAEGPRLDFAVIGAAKAGTTALFNLLRAHPALHLPEGKELPYFAFPSHDYYDSAAAFYADAFRERRPGQLCGTVTPQYMFGALLGGEGSGTVASGPPEAIVPGRIRDAYPEARLIAVLRDPVARARSHQRMLRMRGFEQRSFDQAIAELLEPAALAEARAHPNAMSGSYVMLGEYGRLLRGYLEAFPREQLLVLFHEDLERDPAAACEAVFSFLGIDPGFRAPNLGRRYNEGAGRRRFAWLDLTAWQRAATRSTALTGLWRRLPEGLRRRALNRFNLAVWRLFLWNRAPAKGADAEHDPPSAETLARLRDHYREDGLLLRELLDAAPPWQRSERGGERARPTA
jgi:Sulfotransferase family